MSWVELEQHREAALNPDWAEYDRVYKHIHDWRSYVTAEVRAVWDEIPIEGRLAIVHCCEETASREEWN